MTSPSLPTETAALPSGAQIPLLGFGTWQLEGDNARSSTLAALEAGYRHVDTATVYGNESQVGAALGAAGDDGVFVTTKLPPDRADRARETLERSLEQLGLAAVDLWLIHWPPNGSAVPMWESFVQAQQDGLARDIGVSNFDLDLLDEVTHATGVRPSVNQIEWSPLLFDRAVLDGRVSRGVVLEGYSGLKGGTLTNDVIVGVAERLGRTPAQVIIRWHLQHDTIAIPRSSKPERVVANADVGGFVLSPEDMAAIDALGR